MLIRIGATQAARADHAEQGRLEHAEDAPEHLLGRDPLDQRDHGHVDERVGHADRRECADHDGERRPRADERERHSPQHETNGEYAGEARTVAKPRHHDRPEDPADPERRDEQRDAGVAELQQVCAHDHYQHVERSADERLRGVQADEQPQRLVGGDRAKPGQRLCECESLRGRLRDRPLPRQHRGQQRGQTEERGARDEHRAVTSQCRQRAGQRRTGDDRHALDSARDGVRRGQLLRRLRERRHQRPARRVRERRDDRDRALERDHGRERELAGDRERDRERERDQRQVDRHQHPLTREAIGGDRHQRGRQRARDQRGRERHAHTACAGLVDRDETDRGAVGPAAHGREEQRQLHPAQAVVGRHGAQCAPRVRQTVSGSAVPSHEHSMSAATIRRSAAGDETTL